jgi:hypothetical protein
VTPLDVPWSFNIPTTLLWSGQRASTTARCPYWLALKRALQPLCSLASVSAPATSSASTTAMAPVLQRNQVALAGNFVTRSDSALRPSAACRKGSSENAASLPSPPKPSRILRSISLRLSPTSNKLRLSPNTVIIIIQPQQLRVTASRQGAGRRQGQHLIG